MCYGCNEVSSTCLTLGSNHRCSFVNSSNGLSKFSCSTNEWNVVVLLVDVEEWIRWCQHLRFINHIDAHRFENSGFSFVSNTCLCHHRNRCAVKNTLNHLRMTHTRNASSLADVCRYSLKRHDSNGSSLFSNRRLFSIDDVHDDATLLHTSKASLEQVASVTKLGKIGTRHEYQSLRRFTPSRRLVKTHARIRSQEPVNRLLR